MLVREVFGFQVLLALLPWSSLGNAAPSLAIYLHSKREEWDKSRTKMKLGNLSPPLCTPSKTTVFP